jgi:toxin ParE1/3/4
MRLKQTAKAKADFAEIIDYSIVQFGDKVAAEYCNAIETAYTRLTAYPLSGRAEPDIHPDIRSTSSGSHRIYYSVDGDLITVRRILHKSMDARNWLG